MLRVVQPTHGGGGRLNKLFAHPASLSFQRYALLLLALIFPVAASRAAPTTQELSLERGGEDTSLSWTTPLGEGGVTIPPQSEESAGGGASTTFSRLVAVVFPAEGRDVLFVGKAEPGKPPLDTQELLDAFVLACRARRLGQSPGVTIDPTAEQLTRGVVEDDRMDVRYFGGLEGSLFGWVTFEADRLMKCLSFGRDNITKKPFGCQVPGYRNEMDLLEAVGGKREQSKGKESWHRFWIEMLESRVSISKSGRVFMPDVRLGIKTEYMVPRGGKLESGNCPPDPAAKAFADHMTQSYAAYAEEFPVYRKLQTFAQLTSVAEAIQPAKGQTTSSNGQQPLFDLQWVMNDCPTTPFKTPTITPATVISRTNQVQRGDTRFTRIRELSGGVTLKPLNTTRTADRQADALERAVFAKPAEQRGRDWMASLPDGEYRVASRRLSPRELRLWQTDLRVGPVAVTRQYSASTTAGPASFGRRWQFQQPRLRVATTKITLKDGRRVAEAVYMEDAQGKRIVLDQHVTLTMPGEGPTSGFSTRDDAKSLFCYDNLWILTEGDVRFVAEKRGADKFRISSGGRVSLFSSDESHQVLFTKTERDLVAYTYERGKLAKLSDGKGNSISLTHDAQGRCAKLSGSDGKEINYIYDSNGNLVSASDGRGHSITYRSNTFTGEPQAIRADFGDMPAIASVRRHEVSSAPPVVARSEMRSTTQPTAKSSSVEKLADSLLAADNKASRMPVNSPPWTLVFKDTVSANIRPEFERLEKNVSGSPDSPLVIAIGEDNADFRARLMSAAEKGHFAGKVVFLAACGSPAASGWEAQFFKASGAAAVWRFSEQLPERTATALFREIQKQFQGQLDLPKNASSRAGMLDQTFAKALDGAIKTLQDKKEFEAKDVEKFRSLQLQEGEATTFRYANDRGLATIPESPKKTGVVRTDSVTAREPVILPTARSEKRSAVSQAVRFGGGRTATVSIERTREGSILINGKQESGGAGLLGLSRMVSRNKDRNSVEKFCQQLGVQPGSEIILSGPADIVDRIALAGRFAGLQINIATDLSTAQKNKAGQLHVRTSPWTLVFKDTVSKSFYEKFERLEKDGGSPDNLVIAVGDNNADYQAHLMKAAEKGFFQDKVVFLAACGKPGMVEWVEKFVKVSGALGVFRFAEQQGQGNLPEFVDEFRKQYENLRATPPHSPGSPVDPVQMFYRTLEETIKALPRRPGMKDANPDDIEKFRLILHQLSELGASKAFQLVTVTSSSFIWPALDCFGIPTRRFVFGPQHYA
jgi:hypothetical protein